MDTPSLMLVEPPELADETASEMLDFLLPTSMHLKPIPQSICSVTINRPSYPTDLFEDFDDELPSLLRKQSLPTT